MTAGNIPVDDQNRPQIKGVQRTYLIFLEMKDTISKPLWDTAWIKNVGFLIQALKIEQDKIKIGRTAADQKEVNITPQPGSSLWQLLLTPLPNIPQTIDPQNKLDGSEIILKGEWQGKQANYTVKEVVELEKLFME